jgi:hypothetical protein
VITSKAAQQVLNGAKRDQRDYCFSTDPDCECELDHGSEPATHAITFVTDKGALDTASNKHALGPGWGICGELDYVLDYPQNFPEFADRLIVIDLTTGDCQPASRYL